MVNINYNGASTISFGALSKIDLNNGYITIRRMERADLPDLERQFDRESLKWFIAKYDTCDEFVEEKMLKFSRQESVSFVILENNSQNVIGTMSLYEIDYAHRRLEMGATWWGREFKGNGYNQMSKFLLLEHIFETLQFNRVQWKTDSLNLPAKKSLLAMGFTFEGSLRHHTITHENRVRDSLIFSVIYPEWHNKVKPTLTGLVDSKFFAKR
jgi:RimJ/RimL family protein N-acetyltransferase